MVGTRIVFTESAREALRAVKAERGDRLSLVIGNGCCDSTAPFLFADYLAGPNELVLAQVDETQVLIDRNLERSFSQAEVVVDATKETPPADSFSCEAELGYRFKLRRLPLA